MEGEGQEVTDKERDDAREESEATEEGAGIFAADEEGYDAEADTSPVGPKIDDEAGEILDRLAGEQETLLRRAEHSDTMNATIRKGFGR